MSTDSSPQTTAPDAVLGSADPDDLVVIVAPEEVFANLDEDVICWRAHDPHSTERSDVAQLTAEIERLEHELERKQVQLDAVVTRNEQILAERTRAYQTRLAEPDRDDGFRWHGRKQEWPGLLDRAKRRLRDLLP